MGVCSVIVLGASPGQMSVIPAGTAAGEEVIIHTFEAMDVDMLMLLTLYGTSFLDTILVLGM